MENQVRPSLHLNSTLLKFLLLAIVLTGSHLTRAQQPTDDWLQFIPTAGQANDKHIVLIGGDEEYRSEESLPMLAKILSTRHGFRTTVLFAIDPQSGFIDPNYSQNIPGLHLLSDADLMIISTRFRELPDQQMEHIHNYLFAGKPVIGLRTATHAFHYSRNPDHKYAKYGYKSTQAGWEGGFGKRILGENWVNHHGNHGKEGTRALLNGLEAAAAQPILQGVTDIFAPTDVYGIKSLPLDSRILLWGQTTESLEPSGPVVWSKSVMPLAWTRNYLSESGKQGRVFTTTLGASIDFLSEDLRRLLINASYWATGLEKNIPAKSNVDFVGSYEPTMFGMNSFKKAKRPSDYK
jgi:type 1 glutamine amidotransferase